MCCTDSHRRWRGEINTGKLLQLQFGKSSIYTIYLDIQTKFESTFQMFQTDTVVHAEIYTDALRPL